MNNVAIIIPAYQPNIKLIEMIVELKKNDFSSIIIVDDGSDDSCAYIFTKAKELGCFVIKHHKNKGKGEALKTGIKFAVDNLKFQNGIVTVDADGQHSVKDIIKVTQALIAKPHMLILGTRDFMTKKVPFKSCFGNKITSFVFKSTTGIECKDTQTGLRGIPANLIDAALQMEGSRYEYEYNFLLEAVKQTEIHTVEIETIYFDNNNQSHFRPFRDSMLIYKRPIKFIASSFVGFLTDIVLFTMISMLLSLYSLENIIIATVIARTISGLVNYIINKNSVFGLKGNTATSMVKYFSLFLFIMGASAVGTMGTNLLLENSVLSKIIVDIALFFFSYIMQKNWVFVNKMSKRQISKVWIACATLFFIGYVSFTLLDRFVIAQNVVSLDDIELNQHTEQNLPVEEESGVSDEPQNDYDTSNEDVLEESEPIFAEPVITETSYIDENIEVTLNTIREYDTDIYIAEIIISDSSLLQAGLAENSFGTNVEEKTSVIAEENDAIIAINGDYYGFRDYGYVMRNGYLYRDIKAPEGNEDLVIFEDGNMQIIDEGNVLAEELVELGAVQIFSFGPGLISGGEITVTEQSKVEREDASNPRTAIAMIEPNHYIFMTADGRTEISEGLSLYEMAMVLSQYDCEVAYNLDGGGSATMVFMGEVVNNPTTNGRDFRERSVSDIVYIGK